MTAATTARPTGAPARDRRVAPTAPLAMLAVLRVGSSYSWLSGALIGKDAKIRPDFLSGRGLLQRVDDGPMAFRHTALFGWVGRVMPSVIGSASSLFAWLLLLGELGVGVLLVLGRFTRLAGLLAIVQAVVQWLAAGGNGADTIGHNWMLALAGLVVLVTGAGRVAGLDGALLRRWPGSRALRLLA